MYMRTQELQAFSHNGLHISLPNWCTPFRWEHFNGPLIKPIPLGDTRLVEKYICVYVCMWHAYAGCAHKQMQMQLYLPVSVTVSVCEYIWPKCWRECACRICWLWKRILDWALDKWTDSQLGANGQWAQKYGLGGRGIVWLGNQRQHEYEHGASRVYRARYKPLDTNCFIKWAIESDLI